MKTLITLLFGIVSHGTACLCNYYAWVEDNLVCKILLWIVLILCLLGFCRDEYYDEIEEKLSSKLFWALYIPASIFELWVWFIKSDASFYGSSVISATCIMFYVAYQKTKLK